MAARKRNLPPGPKQPPFIQLARWYRDPPGLLDACRMRYGDRFTIRMPVFGTFVVLSSPEDIRDVFRADGDHFDNGGPYSFFASSLGPESLLAVTGEVHRRDRKSLGGALRAGMGEARYTIRAATRRALDESSCNTPIALRPLMESITFEVIAKLVLGIEAGPSCAEICEGLRRGRHPIVDALLRRVVPGFPKTRSWREIEGRIDAYIASRRSAPPSETGDDLLARLLATRSADGQRLPDSTIRGRIFHLLLAGHATTAAALGWAFHLILEHPEVHRRIEAEIGEEKETGFEYLDATIKEVLRIRPLLPVVCRRLAVPLDIADCSYAPGVTLAPCIYLMHRRPNVYPEPDRFEPVRFLDRSIDHALWLPFGGGFRRCLGADFALIEMRIIIATVLTEYTVALVASETETKRQSGRFSNAPSNDLKVAIKRKLRA